MALGLGLGIYFNIQSWAARFLIILPVAFGGAFVMKYLLARFGRFIPLR
jgi:phage shock protein PspC (stress-responsive transcriptional regulator)